MNNSDRLKAIRLALGISVNEMSSMLGLDSSYKGGDRVREMERGAREVTGPISKLMRYLEQSVEVDEDSDMTDLAMHILPRFMDCTNLEDDDAEVEIVMHTRFPRFYAVMTPDKLPAEVRQTLDDQGVYVVGLPEELGLTDMVILWIDEPIREPGNILQEAAQLKIKQAMLDIPNGH